MSLQAITQFFSTRTLTRDLTLRLALAMILVLSVLGGLYYAISISQAERDLAERADELQANLASVLSSPLWSLDTVTINQVADAYLQTESVAALRVLDEQGRVLYEHLTDEAELLVKQVKIEYNGRSVGTAELSLSRDEIRALQRSILATTVVVVLVVALTLFGGMSGLLQRYLYRALVHLTEGVDLIAQGDYHYRIAAAPQVDINNIIERVNRMAEQIEVRDQNLEQQVAARTRDLQERSAYLEASAEVGRAAVSILDRGQLLTTVVDLIRERFNLYYVGLFLMDDNGEWAVLRAGTGAAGQEMLRREHRLRAGSATMIGQCVAQSEARIALDVGAEAVRFDNPLLPDTRSEAALPLRSRGRILGALTVQSAQPSAFDQDTIVVLQTMADQVAVALDNARLFAEAQQAIDSERRAYGELGRQSWLDMARGRAVTGYRYVEGHLLPLGVQRQEAEEVAEALPVLRVPLKLRDRVIGVMKAHKPEALGGWTAEETQLMATFAEQVMVALEGARLFEETQQRAAQERLAGEISARLRAQVSLDQVLEAAAQDLGALLGMEEVVIQLALPERAGAPQPANSGPDAA